jgi:hypothetical protein
MMNNLAGMGLLQKRLYGRLSDRNGQGAGRGKTERAQEWAAGSKKTRDIFGSRGEMRPSLLLPSFLRDLSNVTRINRQIFFFHAVF